MFSLTQTITLAHLSIITTLLSSTFHSSPWIIDSRISSHMTIKSSIVFNLSNWPMHLFVIFSSGSKSQTLGEGTTFVLNFLSFFELYIPNFFANALMKMIGGGCEVNEVYHRIGTINWVFLHYPFLRFWDLTVILKSKLEYQACKLGKYHRSTIHSRVNKTSNPFHLVHFHI